MTGPSAPGPESTERDIDLTAGHARSCGMRRRGTCARHDGATAVPGGQPRRTQDTGEQADGTEVRIRHRRKESR